MLDRQGDATREQVRKPAQRNKASKAQRYKASEAQIYKASKALRYKASKVERQVGSSFTKEGTLLVDGFLASCYASFPHRPAQIVFAPVKMFPRQLLDDESSQHVDGVRRVVKAIKTIGELAGLRRNATDEKRRKAQLERPSWPEEEESNLVEAKISAFVKNTEF